MEKKKYLEFPESKKNIAVVQSILRTRSARSLELARKRILKMNIESSQARRAIRFYAEQWDDIAHPGILALSCEAVGGNIEKAIPLQVATLLLTATMDLHDDIIDQSRIKNGRPTVFGRFGKDITLLIGDAFFLEGFVLLYKNEGGASPGRVRRMIEAIKQAYFEVGNAHLLEVALKGRVETSSETYLNIIEKKAWSIGVHASLGAILGGGTPKEIQALENYGKTLGTLIILREEFVDLFESEELRSRMKNECLPLPLLHAFKDCGLKKKLLTILSKPEISKGDVGQVVRALIDNKVVDEFRKHMQDLSLEATESISFVKNRKTKSAMKMLIQATLTDI
jgi:geranylgeranyl pyrophosphate synthase